MRELKTFQPSPSHQRRRYSEWIDPPRECNLCGGPTPLVYNRAIYGTDYGSWPLAYFCLCCGASVGCHPNSVYPKGTLADDATKKARSGVHRMLDPIWEDGGMTRTGAYAEFSRRLGLPPWETAHVGAMDLVTCRRAIEVLRAWTLAEDFG